MRKWFLKLQDILFNIKWCIFSLKVAPDFSYWPRNVTPILHHFMGRTRRVEQESRIAQLWVSGQVLPYWKDRVWMHDFQESDFWEGRYLHFALYSRKLYESMSIDETMEDTSLWSHMVKRLSIRVLRQLNGGKDSLLNKWCWENWISTCKRIEVGLLLNTI